MSKKKVALGVVAGVLVVGGVAGGLNASKISAYYWKNYGNPSKYYQYVEAESLKKGIDSYGELYKEYQEQLKKASACSTTESTLEISDLGKEQLAAISAGIPKDAIAWFNSLKLTGMVNFQESTFSMDGKLAVNNKDLLNVNFIGDTTSANYYYKMPEISDKYLEFNLQEWGLTDINEDMIKMLKTIAEKKNILPEKEKVDTVLERYGKILITSADHVKREKNVSVKVEDMSVKTTKLTSSWEGRELAALYKELLTTMKDDKELESVINSMSALSGNTEEMDYNSFKSSVEESLKNFDEKKFEKKSLDVAIYVDADNQIVGRDVFTNGKEELSYKLVTKNEDFAAEITVYDLDKPAIKVTGSGKNAKSSLTGDFLISYEGEEVAAVNVSKLDLAKAKKGETDLEFTVTLTGEEGLGKDYSFPVKLTGNDKEGLMEVNVLYQGEALGKLSVKSALAEPKEIKIPAKDTIIHVKEDRMGIYEWLDEFDQAKFDALKKKLTEANFPALYTQLLEDGYKLLKSQIELSKQFNNAYNLQ